MLQSTIRKPQKLHALSIFLIFSFGVVLSKLFHSVYGTVLLTLLTAFLSSVFFSSARHVGKFAIHLFLIVGLSPIYLIARGFVTRDPLNALDLQVYLGIFFLVSILISFLTNKKVKVYPPEKREILLIASSISNLVLFLFVEYVLRGRSLGNAVAWISSGDSKNHLVNGVDIISYGFLDPTTFWIQPVSSPTFLSLMISQDGATLSSISESLKYQILVYAYAWILLIGILGVAISALSETIWKNFYGEKRDLPVVVLICSSLLPTLSFLLGPALFDGFFTAAIGISAVVAIITWFIDLNQKQAFNPAKLLLGFVLLASSVMAWMFVFPFTFTLYLVGLRNNLRYRVRNGLFLDFVLITVSLISILLIHFSQGGQKFIYRVKYALNTDGAVSGTNPYLFVSLLVFILALGIFFRKFNSSLSNILITVSGVQLAVLVSFRLFSNLGLTGWNYYLLKYQWIMFSATVALFFGFILTILLSTTREKSSLEFIAVITVFTSFYLASEGLVSINNALGRIWNGWDNPRAVTMDAVFKEEIDAFNPTLFFHYGYSGESRLANFWLTAFTEPIEPIKGWNYTIDTTGDARQMCDVNAYYPTVTIVTSDIKLEPTLAKLCSDEIFNVKLAPPLFD